MNKVLIVANIYHASPRIPGLMKYLPEFGWQPILLTPPLRDDASNKFGDKESFREKYRVIETFGYNSAYGTKGRSQLPKRYSFLKPLLRPVKKFLDEIHYYPDSEKGWIPWALNKYALIGKTPDIFELHSNHTVDAIISSSSPVSAHLIAKELKRRLHCPWIADLRDLWTQNHNYHYSVFRKFFERRLERRTLSTADALVTVSGFWAEKLEILHKKQSYYVPNGFDPELLKLCEVDLTSKFTITYTGQIYYGKQDPTKLFHALNRLISNKSIDSDNVEVRFFGEPKRPILQTLIDKYGVSNIVRQYGIIPIEEVISKQKESQVLLLLNWEDPAELGWYSGKIYEYLVSQRPILITGGMHGDVKEYLLTETNAGVYCPAVEDIEKALESWYSEFKSLSKVQYHGNLKAINQYSYREMARKYSEILNQLAG